LYFFPIPAPTACWLPASRRLVVAAPGLLPPIPGWSTVTYSRTSEATAVTPQLVKLSQPHPPAGRIRSPRRAYRVVWAPEASRLRLHIPRVTAQRPQRQPGLAKRLRVRLPGVAAQQDRQAKPSVYACGYPRSQPNRRPMSVRPATAWASLDGLRGGPGAVRMNSMLHGLCCGNKPSGLEWRLSALVACELYLLPSPPYNTCGQACWAAPCNSYCLPTSKSCMLCVGAVLVAQHSPRSSRVNSTCIWLPGSPL
jgi:hypothetical protein